MRRNDTNNDGKEEPDRIATRYPQLFFARLLQCAECPQYRTSTDTSIRCIPRSAICRGHKSDRCPPPRSCRRGERLSRECRLARKLFPKKRTREDLEGSNSSNKVRNAGF
mmetsp:Transcript_32400/g.32699  ORF Transcript_32400/g.32699 Transcript_32400/m.32699 type:complete len:110 (-) Transcript_32400:685-1014(-)